MEIKKVRGEKVWKRGERYGERELVIERGRERGKDRERMERAR